MIDDAPELTPLQRAFLALERSEARLDAARAEATEPIAIIAVGCRVPGASDPEALWQLLRDGVDAIGDVPPDRWDIDELFDADPSTPGKMSTRHGGFLEQIDQFDPQVFGIAPREAASMDPQQRLLLEVTWETLERAAIDPFSLAGTRTGVFIGVTTSDYAQLTLNSLGVEGLDAYYASGVAHSVASGRLSYVLGLEGPSISLDTACSSSLTAIHLAVQSLRLRDSDMALAGGVNVITSPETSITLSKYNMMAPDGRCKFGASTADGFVRAEGCSIVALKRLSDARADGDPIVAVIRGSAIGQDGASSGLTAPNGPSQEAVIRAALANGGVHPDEVSYIEAHGTGTSLGDPIEVQALASVFGGGHSTSNPLVVGSVKTNLGHMEAAAGVTGLVKLALMFQHRQVPASLHFTSPNPHIPWQNIPIEVPTGLREWLPAGRRVAGLSSFGFSGTNVHLVIEEAPAAETPTDKAVHERPAHVLTLSARSEPALRETAGRYRALLADDAAPNLADVAFTAAVGRTHFDHRAAVVASDRDAAVAKLDAISSGDAPPDLAMGSHSRADPPKVAFLFTGQGAQYAGMGRELYETQPVFRAALDHCATVLSPHLEHELLAVMYANDESTSGLLDQTMYTQPATVAIEYGLSRLWESWGITPSAAIGHSIGEFAAAVAAGVMSIDDALVLAATRGRLMQELPAGGAMTSVFASADVVEKALSTFGGRATIAAFNGPEHVVISGPADAIDELTAWFERNDVRCRPLVVSHAFHSPLIDPMLDEFAAAAGAVTMQSPVIRLISNVTGKRADSTIADAAYWRRHCREPVRFDQGVRELADSGCDVFIEIGSQPTLTGMARTALPDHDGLWLPSLRQGRGDWEQMLASLSSAFVHGLDVDWQGFDAPYRQRRRVMLPTYPFQRVRHWIEPGTAARRRAVGATLGPLLGSRLESPLTSTQFETVLTADRPDFLRDHLVHGVTILPGTGFIEMALAAATAEFGTISGLESVDLIAALPVDDRLKRVQTIITADAAPAQGASFEIHSSGADDSKWVLHARGRLKRSIADQSSTELDENSTDLDALRLRMHSTFDGAEHNARLAEHGLTFGPSLQGIVQIGVGDDEVLADIDLVAERGDYRFHPAVLDACLQSVAWLVGDDGDVFLPIAIERLTVDESPGDQVVAHASIHDRTSRDMVSGDVTVYAPDGRRLAAISGIHFRRINRAALASARTVDLAASVYEVDWEPQGATPRVTAERSAVAPAGELIAAAATRADELRATYDIDAHQRLHDQLEPLTGDYVLRAVHQLVGARPSTQSFTGAELGVADQYQALIDRLLDGLIDDGCLRRDGDKITFVDEAEPDLAAITERWQQLADEHPDGRGQLNLVRRCGEELADVLAGQADPLGLLFPGGSSDDAEQMYRDSPFAHYYNSLAADVIGAAASKPPASRPVRILEIGAGTGGTTSYVLPHLDAERVEYTFTDISPLFVERARERFAEHGFVDYAILDIEADVEAQGFVPHGYDIVVAANVLHATADLHQTFDRVRSLLAPGGALAMMEMTKPERFIDITFGLTPGWWKFTDVDVRPDYLLLDRERWLRFLADAGFTEASAAPVIDEASTERAGAGADLTMQTLFVATSDTDTPSGRVRSSVPGELGTDGRSWLVLADQGDIGTRLAEMINATGDTAVVARAERVRDGRNQPRRDGPEAGDGPVAIDPDDPEQLRDLISGSGATWAGVVHLWSLDDDDAGSDAVMSTQRRRVGSALTVAQTLLEDAGAPRLLLATRGARAVSGTTPDPNQAPLWGLGKVIGIEHPELQCVCVDLDPAAAADGAADLFHELSAVDEAMVAHRNGRRHLARLTPCPDAVDPADEPAPARQLAMSATGALDEMTLEPVDRRAPGSGEVEIRVHAAGMNFRDVMNALAMRDDQTLPGSECAGVVAAVGEGVDEFVVGDAVVAIAPGCFGSFVTTTAHLVVHKPRRLSFVEAATIPLAFLTAHVALHDIASIETGETVLIHAASGGVGLAAVQLAQRAGATPLGTAGSVSKRGYLRGVGVSPEMDSRTLDFLPVVRDATNGRGVDVALNSLTGDFIPATLGTLAPGGRFVELGKRDLWSDDDVAAQFPNVTYHTVPLAEDLEARPEHIGPVFREIMAAVDAGELAPLPVQTFPIADASAAFRYMAQARHIGKIVLFDPDASAAPMLPAPIAPDHATTLITGGLSGLGLLVAEWLVDLGARSVALMGRRPADESAKEAIARMEAAGAVVTLIQGDVGVRADVVRALATIATNLAPLRSVIHSAGVLDDGAILRQDWQRFSTPMHPKVQGTAHLHELTAELPLDHFVLFSSAASMFGSAGQANHAAANSYLDELAGFRRAHGLPGLSINWGAWSEIGAAVSTGAAARTAEIGLRALTPDRGLDALGALMQQGRPQLGVVPIDWSVYLDQFDASEVPGWLRRVRGTASGTSATSLAPRAAPLGLDRSALAGVDPARRLQIVSDFVGQQVTRVLGMADASDVDERSPLHDMGLDSLMAVELRNLLGSGLGLADPLPAVLVFDYPTVEALAGFICDDVLGFDRAESGAADTANADGATSVDALLSAVEDLSDDELDRLFDEQSDGDLTP